MVLGLALLDAVPDNIACPLPAFLVGVGVHPQGDGFVGMAQVFRYGGYVRAIGDAGGREGVAQLVRVQLHAIAVRECGEVLRGRRGEHRRTVLLPLGEAPYDSGNPKNIGTQPSFQ